ncbi:MAG: DUF2070 family protein [Candidatus Caldarchaeum sp.]|nr:DUF2070 family protein [Candidatus Caldarchaeum sp.]
MANTSAGAIADRYRLIMGFHGDNRMLLALLTAFALAFTFFILLTSGDLILGLTSFAAVVASTLLLNNLVGRTLGRRCLNYTARRLNSLSVVEMFIVLAALPVSYLANLISPGTAKYVAAPFITTAVFIGYSVRRAIGYRVNPIMAALLSAPPALAALTPLQVFTGSLLKALQTALTSQVIGIAFMEASRYLIDIRGRIKSMKPFTLLQAFLASLLSGASEELERMVSKLGRLEDVRCELFAVKREGYPPLAVVVSEVHPGPFRTVGSSMFPSLVQQKLAAKGFESVVLKGLSSHEKNIASYEVSEKIAESIAAEAEELAKSSAFTPSIGFPIRQTMNGVSSLSWTMAGRKVSVLTLHPHPMEDLPPEVVPRGADDRMVVVDAHNSFSDGFEALNDEMVEKARELLRHLDSGGTEDGGVYVGFARIVPPHIGLADGMGAGGLSCMVFMEGERKTSVVVADSNNAEPWVRNAVQEVGRGHGCSDAELCTTDTHMVNAVVLGGRGYRPLGEAVDRSTLTALLDEIHRRAVKTLAKASAASKTLVFKNVPVFSDFLETVEGSVAFGVKAYRLAGVLAFAATVLTTLVA